MENRVRGCYTKYGKIVYMQAVVYKEIEMEKKYEKKQHS